MRRFVLILLIMLTIPFCSARDALSDCVVDAIRFTRDIADFYNCLWDASMVNDSLYKVQNALITMPHRYYVDNDTYYTPEKVNGHTRVRISGSSEKTARIPRSVKTEYGLDKENIFFTSDSVAVSGAKNHIEKIGIFMWDANDSIKPDKIHEMIEIVDFGISHDTIYVHSGYSRMDNYARTTSVPLLFNLSYVLTDRGWKNRVISGTNFVGDSDYFKWEYYYDADERRNELDLMVPFAYSRLQSQMLDSDAYGDMRNSKVKDRKRGMRHEIVILPEESLRDKISIPDEIIPEGKEYWFTDSMMYENVNLIEYRDAKFLRHYHQTADTMEYRDKLKDISDKVDARYKYVMGTPEISLKADSITVKFDYYEVVGASEVIADEKWGIVNPPARMLLEPKLEYSVLFLYDRNAKKWMFVEDRIEAKNSPKIYIEKLNKDYFYRLENVSTYK